MIVGLTGGIGSGKSTVATFFKELGVPTYVADKEAKQLMESNSKIKTGIVKAFGREAYTSGKPSTKFIADIVFKDPEKLRTLNNIIHPVVRAHFKEWYAAQKAPYVIKEAAILFESGSNKECDAIITVTAPKKTRIKRVVERDDTTEEAVNDRMKNQWEEEEKVKRSDYVIENIDLQETQQIVHKIHQLILKKTF